MKTCRCILVFTVLAVVVFSGCAQRRPSKRPPIHIIPDMDAQPKYLPQSESAFFPDSAAQRLPVPGTVARGYLQNDDAFYRGVDTRGNFIKEAPVEVTMAVLERGRERFDIYCSPCHSRIGNGRGIMVSRNYPPPPSFHDDRLRQVEDGYIFDVITNGIRNMPYYHHQVPARDRWAIITYLRALQRSQNASLEDIPEEKRDKIREVK